MKLTVLTNSRPTTDLGTNLIVGCTEGQIKITPDFAELLGLRTGDRMAVAKTDEYGVIAFKGGEGLGNKLAASGKYLTMSSANVWDVLDGDEDFNQLWNVEGEGEDRVRTDVDEDTEEELQFVVISFDSKEPKQSRKSSSDDAEENAEEGEVEQI